MVNLGDIVTAILGFQTNRKLENEARTAVTSEFAPSYPELWLNLITSAGDDIQVRVDTSKSFYSIYTLADFDYSKSHKNFTIRKGAGRTSRIYVTLPKPGEIKKRPEYIEWRAKVEEWQARRTTTINEAIEIRFREALETTFPEYQELLNLTDDTARAYFLAKGWEIPDEVTWTNWRPSGWILTSRPDGFGHDCGTYANMDWAGKRISISGWSSDD